MQRNGRFSSLAREVLVSAQHEADDRRHNMIDTDHVALAMVAQVTSVGAPKALRDCGADYDRMSQLVGRNPYATSSKRLELTRDAKRVLELAVVEMQRQAEQHVTVEHLLIGMLQLDTCAGVMLLSQVACDMPRLYAMMDVSLPKQFVQHEPTPTSQPVEQDATGCLPMLMARFKQLFEKRGQ
jgi:ATP-dependent Clp protease ATP-binding subunit ClpA